MPCVTLCHAVLRRVQGEFPLDLVPVDDDVLSLELDGAFRCVPSIQVAVGTACGADTHAGGSCVFGVDYNTVVVQMMAHNHSKC